MKFHVAQIASFNFVVEADTELGALERARVFLASVPKTIPAGLPLEYVDFGAEVAIVDDVDTLEVFDVRE